MSAHEHIMWITLKRRREGLLCYLKQVNCGCDRDIRYERLVIKTPSTHHVLCFSERIPCCAYMVSDVFGVEELIQVGSVQFRIVPPGESSAASVEALYRASSVTTEI